MTASAIRPAPADTAAQTSGMDSASNATLAATAAARTSHTGMWLKGRALWLRESSCIESLHAVAAMKAVSAHAGAASSVAARPGPA